MRLSHVSLPRFSAYRATDSLSCDQKRAACHAVPCIIAGTPFENVTEPVIEWRPDQESLPVRIGTVALIAEPEPCRGFCHIGRP